MIKFHICNLHETHILHIHFTCTDIVLGALSALVVEKRNVILQKFEQQSLRYQNEKGMMSSGVVYMTPLLNCFGKFHCICPEPQSV